MQDWKLLTQCRVTSFGGDNWGKENVVALPNRVEDYCINYYNAELFNVSLNDGLFSYFTALVHSLQTFI